MVTFSIVLETLPTLNIQYYNTQYILFTKSNYIITVTKLHMVGTYCNLNKGHNRFYRNALVCAMVHIIFDSEQSDGCIGLATTFVCV